MTAAGDPAIWADRFRSLDTRFLQRVVAIWPECMAVLPNQPPEDDITVNIVNLLLKEPRARRLFHWLEFQFEPFGFTADGMAYSKGRIDMALILDRERERYLAYECKRLNVVHRGRRSSLATRYVKDGLARFVTEQYAENLAIGCMLGYVMDGDVEAAETKILVAIDFQRFRVGLTAGPKNDRSIGEVKRFFSRHVRVASGQEIEVRHALLPFRRGTSTEDERQWTDVNS